MTVDNIPMGGMLLYKDKDRYFTYSINAQTGTTDKIYYSVGEILCGYLRCNFGDVLDHIVDEFRGFDDKNYKQFNSKINNLYFNIRNNFPLEISSFVIADLTKQIKDINDKEKKKEIINKLIESIEIDKELSDKFFNRAGFSTFGYTSIFHSIVTALYLVFMDFIKIKALVEMVYNGILTYGFNYPYNPAATFTDLYSYYVKNQDVNYSIIADNGIFYHSYTINDSISLCAFELANMIEAGALVSWCENCHRPFISFRKNTIFCNYTSPNNKNKKCSEIGAQVKRKNNERHNKVVGEYRKVYLRLYKRIKRYPGRRDFQNLFDKLRKEKRGWDMDLKEGKKSVEDFLEWLKQFSNM